MCPLNEQDGVRFHCPFATSDVKQAHVVLPQSAQSPRAVTRHGNDMLLQETTDAVMSR